MSEFIISLILLVGAATTLNYVEDKSCSSRWEKSGIASDYGFFSGCQIKVNNTWVSETVYRTVND